MPTKITIKWPKDAQINRGQEQQSAVSSLQHQLRLNYNQAAAIHASNSSNSTPSDLKIAAAQATAEAAVEAAGFSQNRQTDFGDVRNNLAADSPTRQPDKCVAVESPISHDMEIDNFFSEADTLKNEVTKAAKVASSSQMPISHRMEVGRSLSQAQEANKGFDYLGPLLKKTDSKNNPVKEMEIEQSVSPSKIQATESDQKFISGSLEVGQPITERVQKSLGDFSVKPDDGASGLLQTELKSNRVYLDQNGSVNGITTSKASMSVWKGVSYKTGPKKYEARLCQKFTGTKAKYIGTYNLKADAAFAIDNALVVLKLDHASKNFNTIDEYKKARHEELLRLQGNNICIDHVDSIEVITQKIKSKVQMKFLDSSVSKSENPSINTLNNDQSNFPYHIEVLPTQPTKGSLAPADVIPFVGKRICGKISYFNGVSYDKTTKQFSVRIQKAGRKYSLSPFSLETDAAFAFDKASQALELEHTRNFNKMYEYKKARRYEIGCLERIGICIDALDSLEKAREKIDQMVAIRCLDLAPDSLIKVEVTAQAAISDTFDAFLAKESNNDKSSPQTHVINIVDDSTAHQGCLGLESIIENHEVNDTFVQFSSHRQCQDLVEEMSCSVPKYGKDTMSEINAYNFGCSCSTTHCLKKCCACFSNEIKCHSKRCGCIGCENPHGCQAKLKSTNQIQADHLQEDDVDTITHQSSVPKTKTSPENSLDGMVILAVNETEKLPFPLDCIVAYGLEGNERGDCIQGGKIAKVTGVYRHSVSCKILYEVNYNNQVGNSGGKTTRIFLSEEELTYAPRCCIEYSPSGSFDLGNCFCAKVLFCQLHPSITYTIMTYKNMQTNNEYSIVGDATPNQIRFYRSDMS